MADIKLFGLNFFDLVDFMASNILLPIGGLFIAVFVGWIWGFDKVVVRLKEGAENLFEKNAWLIPTWKIFLKYFAPILIFIVFLSSIGLLN